MPARPVSIDDLPDVLPSVVVLVGDEELLVGRAITAVSAATRRQDPTVTEVEYLGGELDGPELHDGLAPSLFSDARLVVIRAAQDVKVAALAILKPYLVAPTNGTTIVLQHAGGAKGKALLESVRKGGALEIGCAKLTNPRDRADFVRNEVRQAGGRIAPDALAALVDAVGSDLRELAAVSVQLVSDSGGTIDVDLVHKFHQGRAEVNGFAVADLAVVGNVAGALEALRFALGVGVLQVVVADALADGVHSIAMVASGGRGDPSALAAKLGMPPWKVKRAAGQMRGWSEPGVRRALGIVAELNADVKGAAADADYALERAVRQLAAARAGT
ncbi:MAG: DNA polymerase III subunit delta [Jatrophihabitantaceae bacterium]